MAHPSDPLPPDVRDALARGDALEAIRLLRRRGDLGLHDAKAVIEGAARASAARASRDGIDAARAPRPIAAPIVARNAAQGTRTTTPSPSSSAVFPPSPNSAPIALPAAVVDALQRGDAMEAIRRLRKEKGIGLQQAKDAIAQTPHANFAFAPGLSPGEMPRGNGALRWILVLVALALALWFAFAR